MSKQVDTIKQLTLTMLIEYSVGSLIVHVALLYLAYFAALKYKADISSTKSTAIYCSTKNNSYYNSHMDIRVLKLFTCTAARYCISYVPNLF